MGRPDNLRFVPARLLHGLEAMATTFDTLARVLMPGLAMALLSSGCATREPAHGPVRASAPPATPAASREEAGYATYVAQSFHGRRSASGATFDERSLVAAHRTLPFGSLVRVTNVTNGRSVTVRIIDRGPYGVNDREGTIIDLSRAAARRLRMLRDGQVPARVEVLRLGDEE
jgi:rare lipoprotein A